MQVELSITPEPSSSWRRHWMDMAGLTASIGCAIHCAAMPIAIGYLPALGLGWLATQGFHQGMAVVCGAIAVGAFFPGWRRHKNLLPTALGTIGICLITSHAFGNNDCCANIPKPCSDQPCESCLAGELESTLRTAVLRDAGQQSATLSTELSDQGLTTDSSLAELISGWSTPLGGLFLICAHLINHRLACRCCRGEQACGKEG